MHLHQSRESAHHAARPLPADRASAPTGAAERVLFLQNAVGNAATLHFVQRTIDDAATPSVQRALRVNNRDITQEYKSGALGYANTVWNDIWSLDRFQQRPPGVQRQMEDQYWKWLDDEPGKAGAKSHPTWGRKLQRRTYDTVDDLEMALYGWVTSKQGRRDEKTDAAQFYGSPEAELRLDKVLTLMLDKIENLHRDHPGSVDRDRRDNIVEELEANNVVMPDGRMKARGTYQGYLDHAAEVKQRPEIRTRIDDGFMDVLRNPENYSMRAKIATVHDLMQYFGPDQPELPRGEGFGLLPTPSADKSSGTTGIVGGQRQTKVGRGRLEGPAHQATRNERDPLTQFARAHALPVWSGHSFSTTWVLEMGRWVSASLDDLTTLAHALFAFWRLDYDHTVAQAPHTRHEVMDIALNFGVPYDPLDPHRTFDRYSGHNRVGAQDRLAAEIDEMTVQTQQRWSHMEQMAQDSGGALAAGDQDRVRLLIDDGQRRLQSFAGLAGQFGTVGPDERAGILRDMLRMNNILRQHINEMRDLLEPSQG
jgi:hypothetical protein